MIDLQWGRLIAPDDISEDTIDKTTMRGTKT